MGSMSPAAVHPENARRRMLTLYALPIVAGLAIRALFLACALDIQPYGDETKHITIARRWLNTGQFTGRFAPGYPFYLSACLRLFGENGLSAAKLFQVILSAVIGLSIMWIARTVSGGRPALWAGWIWSMYLPLVGYTHYLWTESLFLVFFLPAMALILAYLRCEPSRRRSWLKLVAGGLLLGLSMMIRESVTFLPLILIGWIFYLHRRRWRTAFGHALLMCLGTVVVVVPWTYRNWKVHHRFVVIGTTLGKNFYAGLNGHYRNFDYARGDLRVAYPEKHWIRRTFMKIQPDKWEAPRMDHWIDSDRACVRRGLLFAIRRPGYIAKTRIKKIADFLNPQTYIVRHCRLGYYTGWLKRAGYRRIVVVTALLAAVFLMSTAWAGIVSAPGYRLARVFLLSIILYFMATALLVANSRFRIPTVPFLIVFSAAWLANRPWRFANSRSMMAVIVTGLLVLTGLWMLNMDGVLYTARMAW